MTIIVDTNATHAMFNGDEVGKFIYESIKAGKLVYITGGLHKKEVLKGGLPKPIFQQWQLAGRIRIYPDTTCDDCQESKISKLNLTSDDPHIIGLALISGCRVLYSFDAALCKDFKDKKIIDNPRGKVFQSMKHKALLKNPPKPL